MSNISEHVTIMHIAGSLDKDTLLQQSLLYTSTVRPFENQSFLFAVFRPDGKFSFPRDLNPESLEAVKDDWVSLENALDRLRSANFDVAIWQAFGIKSYSIYRQILERVGISFLGPKFASHMVASDKYKSRLALQSGDCSVPEGIHVQKSNKDLLPVLMTKMSLPVVVKVPCLDDSEGVFLCRTQEQLIENVDKALELEDQVLIESFIEGRELRCTVLEDENNGLILLPVIEFHIEPKNIRGFKDKYRKNSSGKVDFIEKKEETRHFLDGEKDAKLISNIEKVVFKAFNALQLQDYAIFDLRSDKDEDVYILEFSMFCSFGSASFIPTMAREIGISDETLLRMMVSKAQARQSLAH